MSTTRSTTKKVAASNKKAPAKAAAKKVAPSNAKTEPAKKVASGNRRRATKKSGLAEAATTGEVKFYRQRGNGTMRFLPYMAPGSDTRKSAELVQKRRDNGDTIGAIAESMSASVATIRRLIVGLEMAKAVEAGEYDRRWDGKATELIVAESKGSKK